MAQDCLGLLKACRTRVAKLDEDGAPMAGAGNLYVSSSLIRVAVTPVFREGQEYESINGCGDSCNYAKDKDRLKRYDVVYRICQPDPELTAMLDGSELITSGGATIGFSPPEVGVDPNPNGVSIEIWGNAWEDDHQFATYPYWRLVLPRAYLSPPPLEIANALTELEFAGYTQQNPNWGDGPANDWPYDTGRSWDLALDDAIPDATCGASILVAS